MESLTRFNDALDTLLGQRRQLEQAMSRGHGEREIEQILFQIVELRLCARLVKTEMIFSPLYQPSQKTYGNLV